jgi:hypothetical protein
MTDKKNVAESAQPQIVVPPKRVRAVSVGVVIALAFSCGAVGFAVGKLTAPAASTGFTAPGGGTIPGGGFPGGGGGFPGGGAPGGDGGGFPGGGQPPAGP